MEVTVANGDNGYAQSEPAPVTDTNDQKTRSEDVAALKQSSKTTGSEIIRFNDLEPVWYLPRAKEPGFMRWLVTWLGGPEGYVNPSRGIAAENQDMAVGYMSLPVGQRQNGLHAHTVAEIYVVLAGQLMGWDGRGESHLAGPGDCIYIPKGVPHGVRCYGSEDAELIWIHDGIEIKGACVYFEGPGPFPQDDEIRIIKGNHLMPTWSSPKAKEPEFMRWMATYVGGHAGFENYNPAEAFASDQIYIGIKTLLPWQREVPYEADDAELCVVLSGKAVVASGELKGSELGRLDGIYQRDRSVRALRNHSDTSVRLLTVTGKPVCLERMRYSIQ